jgi:hypothetical protein
MTNQPRAIQCDMDNKCEAPATMIDNKGFAYCAEHGLDRRYYCPCRKLRDWELRRLQRGEQLRRY